MNSSKVQDLPSDLRQFAYVLDKIHFSNFSEEPFKHIEIFDFLSEEHFNAVITSSQVMIPKSSNSATMIDNLNSHGYSVLGFPGCTTSVRHYLRWLEGKSGHHNQEMCEGFGIAFRLKNPKNKILVDLCHFFASTIFKKVLEDKFNITTPTTIDAGLHKYLHGYEISPHPDIRKKALTYMLNVNPSSVSEDLDIHTHYLVFKPCKRFIGEFWRHNTNYDRCWVPWEWCNTIKQQRRNNSIVIFAPSWNTLHAIKLNYDHLCTQRTQFYGNLWYQDVPNLPMPQYDQFVIKPGPKPKVKNREYSKVLRE